MIAHHPDDMILASFAKGELDEGERLLVATHRSLCPRCAALVRRFECASGAMLEDSGDAPLANDALTRALSRIATNEKPAERRSQAPNVDDYPRSLASRRLGAWRWMAPGVRARHVELQGESPTRAFLLDVAPDTTLLPHDHGEMEWTCVLKGAFFEGDESFARGDFAAAGAEDHHQIRTGPGERCVSLIAMRGALKWRGPFASVANLLIRL